MTAENKGAAFTKAPFMAARLRFMKAGNKKGERALTARFESTERSLFGLKILRQVS